MEERLLAALRREPGAAHPLPQLLEWANVPEKKGKEAKRILKALVKKGLVEREKGRRYRLSRAGQQIEGVVELDGRGQLLLYPDGPRQTVTPITLLPEAAEQADPGDRVRVELVVRGTEGRHYGRLVETVSRPRPLHVGVFQKAGAACFVEIEVDLPQAPGFGRRKVKNDVIVDVKDSMGAKDGQLVQVELQDAQRGRPSARMGRVVKVIGEPGDRQAELTKLMMEHGLDVEFPEEVMADAARFGTEPSPDDMRHRRDVRALPLVTIDSETAKDFDDAVCAVKDGSGYILYVAIADVAHYVRPGSPLDKEARRRGTSTYLTDRAIPMLPEGLSNGLCSLKPKVDRLCMLVEMHLDATGHVKKTKMEAAVMRSHARLTYTRVAQALDGNPPDEEVQALLPHILVLSRVAAKLLERRLKRGAIDLDLPEPEVRFDDKGIPVDALRRPRNDAHRLIEDLMLAANEAVARYFVERDLPCIFRIHEDPDPERLATFLGLLEHLGLKARLSEKPRPDEIAHLLESLSTHAFGKPLHGLLLRSLAQARYAAECKGHYGLAAEHYLHFTSPIRRYPDLVVHRLLKQVLAGEVPKSGAESLELTAEACSTLERKAMIAERSCMDLDRSVIASQHLHEEFDATITGVQGFGLFCSLDQPFLDGLIAVQSLPSDYYELDEFGAMLVGQNTGRRFMLGDRVRVTLVNANVSRRQVDLRLVLEGEDAETPEGQAYASGRDRIRGRRSDAGERRGAKPAARGGKGPVKATKRLGDKPSKPGGKPKAGPKGAAGGKRPSGK
ncbi:MAG: ribonuclease R, partial [Myxococcales bacterium]|nr:ribonuclease R [Myxococcales bacterium]